MALAKVDSTRFTTQQNGGSSADRFLQDNLHRPYSWWRSWLGRWEDNLTVAGRTIEKGWVIPQQLGIALIILTLSGLAGLYWTMDSRIDAAHAAAAAKDESYQQQRDMLIEIKTELRIRKEDDAEFKRKQVERDDMQNLQIQDVKDRILASRGR